MDSAVIERQQLAEQFRIPEANFRAGDARAGLPACDRRLVDFQVARHVCPRESGVFADYASPPISEEAPHQSKGQRCTGH
jgi:hypothetical protein